jgi:hypothetical protein
MSLTLGAVTKLLYNMMVNYSEWHTERAPQGENVNSVEETSTLSDKIDAIMLMLSNDRTHVILIMFLWPLWLLVARC